MIIIIINSRDILICGDCNLNGTCLTITYSDVRSFRRVVLYWFISFAEKLSIDRPRTWAFFVPTTLQKDLQYKDSTIQQQRVNTCRSDNGHTLIQMRSRALWLHFHTSPLDRNPTRALMWMCDRDDWRSRHGTTINCYDRKLIVAALDLLWELYIILKGNLCDMDTFYSIMINCR